MMVNVNHQIMDVEKKELFSLSASNFLQIEILGKVIFHGLNSILSHPYSIFISKRNRFYMRHKCELINLHSLLPQSHSE
eukprot:UN18765